MAAYVVQVAESIDIEDICKARSEKKILEEAGEHVPGIALEMGSLILLSESFRDGCSHKGMMR
jgi:hypothetical protein